MTRSRVLAGIISAVFCLTLVSSARADSSHGNDMQLEKLIFAQLHNLTNIDIQSLIGTNFVYTGHFENNNGRHLGFGKLTDIDIQRAVDTSYLFAANFENNNGKHHGFSVVPVQQGPKLVQTFTPAAAAPTQNPEPTAMVLLGTGLAAAAALARKVNRKRRH